MLGRIRQAMSNAITWENRDDYRDAARYDPDDGKFLPLGIASEYGNARGLAAVPAVYGAVNLLSDQISLLRPTVRRGEYEFFPNHPISVLLGEQPSRLFNKVQFWRIMTRMCFLHGNAHAYIRRRAFGDRRYAFELVPAYCHRAWWVEHRDSPRQRYSLQLVGRDTYGGLSFNQHVEADAKDVITYHGPGYNGLTSPSPVRYAASQIVGIMGKVLQHQSQLLKIDDNSSLFLKSDLGVPYESWDKARTTVEDQVQGVRKDQRIPLLPPGVTLERFQMLNATDLRLIELLKWGVEDVCRVWQVPPARLAHYYQGMRVAGVENQAVDFERFSIQNRTGMLDSENTMKLLPTSDRVEEMEVWTDTSPIGLGTLAERMDVAEQGVARGGMWKIDEGRRLTGQPPLPNGDGDRVLEPKGAPAQNTDGNPSRSQKNREYELGPEGEGMETS